MTGPTDRQLLELEAKYSKHSGRKENAIRDELGITPARFYQLLGRLIWLEEALLIDPMLTNRLRKRSMDRYADRTRQAPPPPPAPPKTRGVRLGL